MNMSLNTPETDTTVITYAVETCPLGQVLMAQNNKGICAVFLGDDDSSLITELTRQFPHHQLEASPSALSKSISVLLRLIENSDTEFNLPLAQSGTHFQQQVWQALREIPAGETISYKQLAEKLGKPTAIRAVASACAANKLAVIIPCHRVIGSNGKMTGYRWGMARKQRLLDIEQNHHL